MNQHIEIKNSDGEILKAGGLVVNENNEVILVSNKEQRVWSFPKGHAEAGETMEQVAKREIGEETGYEVELGERLSDLVYKTKYDKSVRVVMFRAKPISQNVIPEEGTVFKWFSIEEAKKIVYPNLAFLLEEI